MIDWQFCEVASIGFLSRNPSKAGSWQLRLVESVAGAGWRFSVRWHEKKLHKQQLLGA